MQNNGLQLMEKAYEYACEVNSCKSNTNFIHPDPYNSEVFHQENKMKWNNINH